MNSEIRNLFFLGTGASQAELARIGSEYGVMQKDLLPQYFQNNQSPQRARLLRSFFSKIFKIDFNESPSMFPCFEDTLAMIEIALERSDAFKSVINLQNIKLNLLYAIAEILAINLETVNPPNLHYNLLQKLQDNDMFRNSAFMSLNYDIIIDNAILKYYMHDDDKKEIQPDYGFFIHKEKQEIKFAGDKISLFKLHGSLNWLFCPTCYSIWHLGYDKLNSIYCESGGYKCGCQSILLPVLIPPTYLKDISNPYIQKVWFEAEKRLQGVENIFFIGYSLPDADLQVKYLLKRLQINREDNQQLTVYVANRRTSSVENYERFFGKEGLVNLRMDFNEFIETIDFTNPQPSLL